MKLIWLGLILLQPCSFIFAADTTTSTPDDNVPAPTFDSDSAAAKSNELMEQLTKLRETASVNLTAHEMVSMIMFHTSHEKIAIDGNYSEAFKLTEFLTSQYFDFIHKAWHLMKTEVFKMLNVAMQKLDQQSNAGDAMVNGLLAKMNKLVEDSVRVLTDIGGDSRQYYLSVRALVVRHIYAVQQKTGIFKVSRWCQQQIEKYLDWGRTEIEAINQYTELRINYEFDNVIDDFIYYVEGLFKSGENETEEVHQAMKNVFGEL